MDKQSRRDLIREFKERKTFPGVYAVRCGPTGEVWVGTSRNIDSQENQTMTGLRFGGHPNLAIRAAWAAHGAQGVTYEILERLEDETLGPIGTADLLKARDRHWRETLGAGKATG